MKHLYFVRHGLSEMNQAGRWSGSTDTPLTAEGRAQAREAGKAVRSLGIDHIVSSPLSRAHETADIIAKTIGYDERSIESNSLFVERHLGKLEGAPYTPEMDIDLDGIAEIELTEELRDRMRLALTYLESLPHDNILVVSHGASGRMLRHIINDSVPFEVRGRDRREDHRFPNAVVVQLL